MSPETTTKSTQHTTKDTRRSSLDRWHNINGPICYLRVNIYRYIHNNITSLTDTTTVESVLVVVTELFTFHSILKEF
jgi:hypothetical protein